MPKPPLTQKHIDDCRKSLRELHDASNLLPKMQAIGIDVAPLQESINQRREICEAIIREFGDS